MQGSLHFPLIHVKCLGHSELMVHSGRHDGGIPIKSGRQEQTGDSLIVLQSEFGPHGDGTQEGGLSVVNSSL